MSETSQELELRILERAYFLWIEAGRPEGRAEKYYLRACELETGGRAVDERPAERSLLDAQQPKHYTNGSGS